MWATSSFAFLVAAYRLTGWSTGWSSLHGSVWFAPYTDEDDA